MFQLPAGGESYPNQFASTDKCNICDSICMIRQDISPRWVYIGTMASVPSSVQPLAAGCFIGREMGGITSLILSV
jgi:hypothetical protein